MTALPIEPEPEEDAWVNLAEPDGETIRAEGEIPAEVPAPFVEDAKIRLSEAGTGIYTTTLHTGNFTWAANVEQPIRWRQWYDARMDATTYTASSTWLPTGDTRRISYTMSSAQAMAWTGWNDHWMIRDNEYRVNAAQAEEAARRRADQAQAYREMESRRRLRQQQASEERVKADSRAMELLNLVLTAEEKLHLAAHDEIQVTGSDGLLYIIEMNHTVHGNVLRVDEHGCKLGRVCVQPKMYDESHRALPTADGWVGQYLGLKFNAEEFLRLGNWSRVQDCQHPGVPILGMRAA